MRRQEFIAGLAGAAAWPLRARAQQPNLPVIGYLDWFGPSPNAPVVVELRAGLAEAGFIEGTNLSIEYRWAEGNSRSYQVWPPT
jgi:putative tryptophan/tyrosine transport system substrate-binding protein